MASSPAKITRPGLPAGTVNRTRLFKLLDRARAHPVIWIAAPPGSGKTTLVRSYLAQNGLGNIWYQIDAGDADPATFFHYLGLAAKKAAPGTRRPLPHLTPEYLPNLTLFTQRYFEELYGRLKSPGVVVFDNYQEVGACAALHALMATALAVLPSGMNAIVISREEPPPPMARLRAARALSVVDWEALRLSAAESRSIAAARNPELSDAQLRRLGAQADGWAAGLILALESQQPVSGVETEHGPPQAVFDYFAEEIFAAMSPEVQAVLLQCAYLPWVREAQAVQLTGVAGAGRVLASLGRRGYFTSRHASGYQFHPLFRAFLRGRAERTWSPGLLREVRCRAAAVLEPEGELCEATALLADAAAWDELALLVGRHAPVLLQQGRGATVFDWLASFPPGVLADSPWLLYWRGMSTLPFAPLEARASFEAAFQLFTRQNDRAGVCLAWAGVIDTFFYDWGDFALLDPWLAMMDAELARGEPMPTPEIGARVACGMFVALTWRRPDRADLEQWADRVLAICLSSESASLKMMLGNGLLSYYTVVGDFSRTPVVVDALRVAGTANDNTPLTQLQWWTMLAMYSWFAGEHAACLRAVEAGERLSEETGIRLLNANLYAQGIYSAVSNDDGDLAMALLEKMLACGLPRPMDKMLYHYQAASVYLYRGDLARAKEHGLAAKALAMATGTPIPEALLCTDLACIWFALGEHEIAEGELARAVEVGKGMKLVAYMADLYRAGFALEKGEREAALNALRRALGLAARCSFVNAPRWNRSTMARLFAMALETGIEPDHVRRVIALRKLVAPPEVWHCEAWPRRFRIYTLGSFRVERDGGPLRFSGKAQRKPLELLQALIAFGGRDVPARKLAETLWPEEAVGAPMRALYAALHRLRKLLGDEHAVGLAGNRLFLDPARVWVDLWALEEELTQAEQESTENDGGNLSLLERTLSRYQGPFLAEVEECAWVVPMRHRLSARVRQFIAACGRGAQSREEWERAAAVYERGLALDALDEAFYRELMICHHALDCPAEVTAVYRRCTQALQDSLGVSAAGRTEELHQSLLASLRGGVETGREGRS